MEAREKADREKKKKNAEEEAARQEKAARRRAAAAKREQAADATALAQVITKLLWSSWRRTCRGGFIVR